MTLVSDCGDALDRLEQFLDGELEEYALVDIARHLAACYPCGDRAEFERHVRELVRHRCHDQAPEALIERVRVRIQRVTEEAR